MRRASLLPATVSVAIALCVMIAFGQFTPTRAEPVLRRVALVIGNSAYAHVPMLPNPASDARMVAQTLASLGFEVMGGGAQTDLDRAGLIAAVRRFSDALSQGATVGMFYYAGHGVQVDGLNYLVPVDANPTRAADAPLELVDADIIVQQMQAAGSRLNLIVLDACRNNPFVVTGMRGAGGGLASMRAPRGTLIAYATQPGNIALDGTDGHSPFTRALVDTMREPGLDVFRTFNQVGLTVDRTTRGAQVPWLSSSPIDGEFFFSGQQPGAGVPAPVTTGPAAAAPSGAARQAGDGCRQGFVWREATAADHVCVTPGTRAKAWDDNQRAAERVQPAGRGGARDGCRYGFVWREAMANDHVCVSPGTRAEAWDDNSHVAERVAR